MDVHAVFEQMKVELKEKWLDYYEANRDWIKSANLHRVWQWQKVVNNEKVNFYCPDSKLIIGVITVLDDRVSGFIYASKELSRKIDCDFIVIGLGLAFDVEVALEERQKEQEGEIQEAKLLTAGHDNNTEEASLDKLGSEDS